MKKINFPNASFDTKNIAPKLGKDNVGRTHYRSVPLESYAAARFAHIQERMLHGELHLPNAGACIAMNLVLYDGVATSEDLERALGNVDGIYSWRGWICLDWLDDSARGNRRYVSVFTQTALALPRVGMLDMGGVKDDLCRVLQESIHPRYTFELLLADARAWLRENISDPLYGHCIGTGLITSLPRAVLAREESGLALSNAENRLREESADDKFALALGAYLDPSGPDHGSWLIAELIEVCRRDKSLSNTEDRQRMLKACAALAPRTHQAGPTAALIVAWVIDLLESGTRSKSVIKAVTAASYVAAAAQKLLTAFRKKVLEDLSSSEFSGMYRGMLEGLSSSRARTLASALASWHYFISCWLDISHLRVSLHKQVPLAIPKANVVWPDEVGLIRLWLAEANYTESRFHDQVVIAFEILVSIRIRATELLNLRMCNLNFKGSTATIEIATRESDGGVKTTAGKRVQDLKSEPTIRLLRQWLARRTQEGALPDDYLFGDPYRPEQRYCVGQLYLKINRLLKSVSGDPTMATHVFSHTHISFSWLVATKRGFKADINPFEAGAAAAGHESPSTGFASYFHFAEEWLRNELDKALARDLARWPAVRNHVCISHDAYRQECSRWRRRNSDISTGEVALHFIQKAAPSLMVSSARGSRAMVKAISPLVYSESRPVALGDVLDVLNDIWYGHSSEVIALRSGRDLTVIASIVDAALGVLLDIGEVERSLFGLCEGSAIALLGKVLNGPAGNRIQFSRAGQDKVAFLYNYLQCCIQRDVAVKGAESWARCYSHGYLSLEYPALAAGMVALLDAADCPRTLLGVRGAADLHVRTEAGIEALFANRGGVMPCGEIVHKRYGRPKVYLVLASSPQGRQGNEQLIPSAAVNMAGLHALMFSAAICQRLFKCQSVDGGRNV